MVVPSFIAVISPRHLLLIGLCDKWDEALSRALGMLVCFQIFFSVGITNYLIQTADPIRAFGCPSGARTQDTAVNSRMLVPTELRGNIRKERRFTYIRALLGNALKKPAKKMLNGDSSGTRTRDLLIDSQAR